MKYINSLIAIVILFSSISVNAQNINNDNIYYASLNRAIHLGQYDGVTNIQNLKKFGNFGLGSEEKLNNELVLLDGVAYGIPITGKAKILSDKTKVAFSAVKFFKSDKKVSVTKALNLNDLESYLSSVINKNSFAAIKISGSFKTLKFTSYYPQQKPYKPTKEVQTQEFNTINTKGAIVGFYTPESAQVLNSPTYHFHFIDQNKTTGGHIQDCLIDKVQIEIDYTDQLTVGIGDYSLYNNIDLNKPIPKED